MIISFFSNYLTHHQIPFCEAMCKLPEVEFHFVSTMPMEQERKAGGWELHTEYPYELKAYASEENKQEALRLARQSDVMLIGSAPEVYVQCRMKYAASKLTLRYSERIYKGGRWRALSPRGALLRLHTYFRYLGKPLYMLCASAYTAGDLAILGSYLGRCYKWGYFPATKTYENLDAVMDHKEPNTILWTARMIHWKHPEIPVEIARRLKADGYDFRIDMIGTGAMEQQIKDLIGAEGLQEQVHLLGTMTPEQVREQMERHQLFLFTSDQNEGWGAVLNEAMNSGCAVIADDRIGSVPFLVRPGKNGLTYHKGDIDQLYAQVKNLLDYPQTARKLGIAAYKTITEAWSPEQAAQRLLDICTYLLAGEKRFFTDGPCSKAYICLKKRSS